MVMVVVVAAAAVVAAAVDAAVVVVVAAAGAIQPAVYHWCYILQPVWAVLEQGEGLCRFFPQNTHPSSSSSSLVASRHSHRPLALLWMLSAIRNAAECLPIL